jgi:hypothetical protein
VKSDDFGSGVYEAGLCLTFKSIVLRGADPYQTIRPYTVYVDSVKLVQKPARSLLSLGSLSTICPFGQLFTARRPWYLAI